MKNYRGVVIDRLDDNNGHYTYYHTTWEEAHHAAEKLAKRLGLYTSDRFAIAVEDKEGGRSWRL